MTDQIDAAIARPVVSAVRTVSEDDNVRIIEGLAIPFGGPFHGRDTYGTFFSARTDLGMEPEAPAVPWRTWYHHGLDPDFKFSTIGTALPIRTDADGVWVQAQLDKRHRYYETRIKPLLDDPRGPQLGLSAGSAEHSYRDDRRTGELLDYPVHEISLTPTESNPFAFIAARSGEIEATLVRISSGATSDEPAPASAFTADAFRAWCEAAMDASQGASVLSQLLNIINDESDEPEQLAMLQKAADSLTEWITAERAEIVAPTADDIASLADDLGIDLGISVAVMSGLGFDAGLIRESITAIRAGKRNSSSDASHLVAAHDHLVSMGAHDESVASADTTPATDDEAAARSADAAAQPATVTIVAPAVRSDAPDPAELRRRAEQAGRETALRLVGR